jgi:large conductance mechanosensitive channel
MIKGFKEFITRGSVIDVAVGFVAGAAFTALVTGVTGALVTPTLGLITGGGVDAGSFTINGQVFDFSLIVNAFITFFITMMVIYFVFVLPLNKLREHQPNTFKTAATDNELLTEIRDLLRQSRGNS